MKREARGFRPTALDGTHQLEQRIVLSQLVAARIGSIPQTRGTSQDTIDRSQRDVNQAFKVLSNEYATEFAFELHTFGETGQLARGFNDDAVDLLNQQLLGVISRLPHGGQDVGTDVVAITELMRVDLNNLVSVDRASGSATIAYVSRLAHDIILGAQARVQGVVHDHITSGGSNGGTPPPVIIPPIDPAPPIGLAPPLDSTLPSGPSNRVSQETIDVTRSYVNWSIAQLNHDYSRAFNLSLRGVEGTRRLTLGFNDHQVGQLNQRMLRLFVRLPYGLQIVGPYVIGIADSLRAKLNNQESVDRTSDPASIAFASRSAQEAILKARAQLQGAIQVYVAIGEQYGLFEIR